MCIYVTGVPEEPLEPGSSRSEIKSHNSEGEAEDDEYIFVWDNNNHILFWFYTSTYMLY